LKSSATEFSKLPIVLEEIDKLDKDFSDHSQKRRLQKEIALDKKLVTIREIAIKRKFKRLNLEDQSSLWSLLVEPLLKDFQKQEASNFNLSNFKSRVLRIFLEKMSYHIYNTLSKLSKDQVLLLIEQLKKESLQKSQNTTVDKKDSTTFSTYSK